MIPYWPFQQYEAERADGHVQRRKAASSPGLAGAAASAVFGYLTRWRRR
jgi:hypothetical protein